MAEGVEFNNPPAVAAPIGAYSHAAVAPAGSQVIAVAGQVGVEPDGNLPAGVEDQYRNALRNVVEVLRANGVGPEAILKLNTYLVAPMDVAVVKQIRESILGQVKPAATLVYVPRLAAPQYLVEVEAWAARPPR